MLAVEAAGFDTVLVETVGVGQSETTVSRMTDMFLLLLLPAGGDELQGIKRGIVELADLILVNKADGNLMLPAEQSVTDYRKAMMFMAHRSDGWQVPVEAMSALGGERTAEVWKMVEDYQALRESQGLISQKRAEQSINWMWSEIRNGLVERLRATPEVAKQVEKLEQAVRDNRLSPTSAADELMEIFIK